MSKDNLTGERLVKIETDIAYIKAEQDSNKCDHEEIKKMIKDFIESADKKYASKLTEQLMYGMVVIIIVGVLGALVKLVLL